MLRSVPSLPTAADTYLDVMSPTALLAAVATSTTGYRGWRRVGTSVHSNTAYGMALLIRTENWSVAVAVALGEYKKPVRLPTSPRWSCRISLSARRRAFLWPLGCSARPSPHSFFVELTCCFFGNRIRQNLAKCCFYSCVGEADKKLYPNANQFALLDLNALLIQSFFESNNRVVLGLRHR